MVSRPHGVRGTVHVNVYNKTSEIFGTLEEITLRAPDGSIRAATITAQRPGPKSVLVDFQTATDRNAAEALRGSEICVPRSALPDPEPGEYYHADLLGLSVLSAGEPIGVVEQVLDYPSVECLQVRLSDARVEIPMLEDWMGKIDLGAGTVEVGDISELPRSPLHGNQP